MKQVITLFFLFLLLFTASCSQKENENKEGIHTNAEVVVPTASDTPENTRKNAETTENTESQDIKKLVQNISDEYASDPEFSENVAAMVNDELRATVTQKAITEKKVELCNDLQVETDKKNCQLQYYLTNAIEKKDVKLCTSITETSQKNICHNLVTEIQAIKAGDEKICDTIAVSKTPDEELNEKDHCKNKVFIELAFRENDPKKCEFITDNFEKELCQESIIVEE